MPLDKILCKLQTDLQNPFPQLAIYCSYVCIAAVTTIGALALTLFELYIHTYIHRLTYIRTIIANIYIAS